jgi:MFS family permease
MGVAGRSRPNLKVKGLPVRESVRRGMVRVRRAKRQAHLPSIPFLSNRIGRSSAAAIEGLSPEAALHARRNFRLGVLNGVMFTLVEAIIAPSIVLAWFINRLGAPNALVGLLPAILAGGWFLPQILVASRVQGLPLVMHWYRRVGILRVICMALLVPSTILLADQPVLLLFAFFTLYIIYAFGAGVSGIPWLEMVSKVIPPRRRGTFFGLRSFWGGVAGLLVAGPVAAIMSEQLWGLTFPYNFALLFGMVTVVVALGVWCWASIKEPAAPSAHSDMTVGQLLRRGMEAFKTDRDYRSFMVARILISLAAVADPFYVVYAKTNLAAPPATVGLYLGAVAISSLLSNFLWSPLADRAGNRTLMSWTVLSVAVVPLTALLLSLFAGVVNDTLLFTSFSAVFVFSGLALGASRIVNNNMLLTIAPAEERATYIGFLNLILGVVIFVPVLGGVLADVVGFRALFFLSLVFAGMALLATARMSTTRAER